MRVGGQPHARERLLPEVVEVVLGEPALEEGAGVDARRGVALEEDLVARRRVAVASSLPRKKWLKPTSYSVAAQAYVARWPPIPGELVLARRTIATAFQRISRRIRRSIASSPGKNGSCSGLIVLM